MSLQLIQLFADLGANGLLIEYEDMFPYEGELKVLQSTTQPPYRWVYIFKISFFFIYNLTDKNTLYPNSREEIVSIQDAANRSGLEIIPLVQTYGHLEVTMKPIFVIYRVQKIFIHLNYAYSNSLLF